LNPEITSIIPPVHVVYAGDDYEYDVESNEEGLGLIYSLGEAPDGFTIDDSTGLLTGSLTDDLIGNHYVEIIADDGNGGVAEQNYFITVLFSGNPPEISDLPDVYLLEDSSTVAFDLDTLVNDADTPDSLIQWFVTYNGSELQLIANILELEITPDENLDRDTYGVTASIDDEHVVTIVGTEDFFGYEELIFIATDGMYIATASCMVEVMSVNDPPTILPINSIVFLEDSTGSLTSMDNIVGDVDDDFAALDIMFSGHDSVSTTIVGNAAIFSAPENWNGSGSMELSVIDTSGAEAIEAFDIVVVPVNDPPWTFALISPEDGTTIDTNFVEFFWEDAIDIDENDHLVYTVSVSENEDLSQPILIAEDLDDNAYLWDNVPLNTYYWSVEVQDLEGEIAYSSVQTFQVDYVMGIDGSMIPMEFALLQNYPNPFNPVTTLRYDIPENSHVTITIYDMLGRQVKTLINQTQDAGYRSVIWDATNDYGKPVSAGIYLYQIQAGEYISTKKMVLLK